MNRAFRVFFMPRPSYRSIELNDARNNTRQRMDSVDIDHALPSGVDAPQGPIFVTMKQNVSEQKRD